MYNTIGSVLLDLNLYNFLHRNSKNFKCNKLQVNIVTLLLIADVYQNDNIPIVTNQRIKYKT